MRAVGKARVAYHHESDAHEPHECLFKGALAGFGAGLGELLLLVVLWTVCDTVGTRHPAAFGAMCAISFLVAGCALSVIRRSAGTDVEDSSIRTSPQGSEHFSSLFIRTPSQRISTTQQLELAGGSAVSSPSNHPTQSHEVCSQGSSSVPSLVASGPTIPPIIVEELPQDVQKLDPPVPYTPDPGEDSPIVLQTPTSELVPNANQLGLVHLVDNNSETASARPSVLHSRTKSDVATLCRQLQIGVTHGIGDGASSVASSDLAEFQAIDGGTLLLADRVGKGAFGSVYKCLHETGHLCAAKVLDLPRLAEARMLQLISITKKPGQKLGATISDKGVVLKVTKNSPAKAAGLQVGMAIVTVDKTPVVEFTLPPSAQPDWLGELEQRSDAIIEVVVSAGAQDYLSATAKVYEMVQEAVLLGRLHSEYIIPLYSCALLPGKMVLVMELASGSLLSVLKEVGPLPLTAVRRYSCDMLFGLKYLHAQHVMHADFKTANVLLGINGNCKLTDFGSSRFREPTGKPDQRRTNSRAGRVAQVGGTPMYMAPEAACGIPDAKSDVWALGLVVGELVSGEVHYDSDMPNDAWALTMAISLGSLQPVVPEECVDEVACEFMRRCWVKELEKRPTAEELLEDPFVLAYGRQATHSCAFQSTTRSRDDISGGWGDWVREKVGGSAGKEDETSFFPASGWHSSFAGSLAGSLVSRETRRMSVNSALSDRSHQSHRSHQTHRSERRQERHPPGVNLTVNTSTMKNVHATSYPSP
eukprot:Hpha_TRINITY_DN16082_c1_g1::TRINITY_DN16082_c1_g1_i1::g.120150::m.120150